MVSKAFGEALAAHHSIELILPVTSLSQQLCDVPIQAFNNVLRSLNGRFSMPAALFLPASNSFLLFGSAAILNIELVTDPTFLVDPNILHDELHAACFSSTILLSAVLAERTPLEIAALVVLLVKAE